MKLENRVEHLEHQVEKHLEEAGEVREAIKDLKKSVDTVSNRMWGAVIGSLSTLLVVVGFLLKILIWH